MNKASKLRLCAVFLVKCLSFGWSKPDLDWLEQLWWDGGGWKHSGEYKSLERLRQQEEK